MAKLLETNVMSSKKFAASGTYEIVGGEFNGTTYEMVERRIISRMLADGTVVAVWKEKENEYLRSIGKDPAALTEEERKTLLFGFLYGTRLTRD